MADTGGIRAGKAFVEVYADKTQLTRGLKAISGDLKTFGKGVSSLGKDFLSLGAGLLAPLLGAVKHFADAGSKLNDMAARTGMSTNALSELGYAAKLSGASLEDVEGGARKMQKAIAAAADGSMEQRNAFAALGLTMAHLKGMSPDQQFEAIGSAIARINDPTQKAAMAMKVFGKGGTALIPMLGDMQALRAEAQRLGLSMGPEQAAAADAMGDAWDSLTASFGGAVNTIGGALAPAMTSLATGIRDGITVVRQFVKDHQEWITRAAIVAAGLVAVGATLFIAGKAITIFGGVFSGTLAIMKAGIATLGFLKAAVLLLANPWVLLGAGVLAAGGYFLIASGKAKEATQGIVGAFKQIQAEVTSSMDSISQSIAAGDFAGAAKVGWALMKLEWTKGVSFVTGLWDEFKGYWDSASSGIALALLEAWTQIRIGFAGLVNFMSGAFTNFAAGMAETLTTGAIGEAFRNLLGVSKETFRVLQVMNNAGGQAARAGVSADDKAAQDQMDRIRKEGEAAKGNIGQDEARRQKERDAKAKAAQDAVDAARQELEGAKGDAAKKADEIAAAKKDEAKKGPGIDIPTGADSKTRGTFSGAAISGLGVGGSAIVREVKKQVDVMKQLLKTNELMLNEQKRLSLEATA